MELLDLTGNKFGRLLVLRRVISSKKLREPVWYCKCDCGGEAVVMGSNLRTRHTESCGCIHREMMIKRNTTHGLRHHKLYKVWVCMFERCTYKKAVGYNNYGGKGVTICKEWYDFRKFYEWAINNGWQDGLRLDKDIIPKKLGLLPKLYSPETCCFVTPKVNSRNTSKTKLIVELANKIRYSAESTKYLMRLYNVCKSTINNILSNKSWVD